MKLWRSVSSVFEALDSVAWGVAGSVHKLLFVSHHGSFRLETHTQEHSGSWEQTLDKILRILFIAFIRDPGSENRTQTSHHTCEFPIKDD